MNERDWGTMICPGMARAEKTPRVDNGANADVNVRRLCGSDARREQKGQRRCETRTVRRMSVLL